MKSMTGYAMLEKSAGTAFISIEIKSYNSRYLDLYINLPFWLTGLENSLRNFFSARIPRGKVEINVKVKTQDSEMTITPNVAVIKAYMEAINQTARIAGIDGNVNLGILISQPDILQIERDVNLEKWEQVLLPLMEEVFANYDKTKISEGKALIKDIQNNLDGIYNEVKVIKKLAPEMEEIFTQIIKERFKEFSCTEINEQRVMQEVALMLIKYTINEEIVRLESHLNSVRSELKKKGAVGKKIDFICQEINREINTIGSKSQMLEIGQAVITIKDLLENIREQNRNLE